MKTTLLVVLAIVASVMLFAFGLGIGAGAADAAQAANPAQVVAGKLAAVHGQGHSYPAGTTTRAACSGVVGTRTWRCTVTVYSAKLLNGSERWKYVCTGRVVRRGHGIAIVNFKAYAVSGIA